MPVLRREYTDGEYKTITISKSIKITRFSSCSLLAERVVHSILDALLIYDLNGIDNELFIMGRPWLSAEDFKIKIPEVTNILNKQIEKETSGSLLGNNRTYSEKLLKLKNYLYDDIYMDNYGDPVFDKNKNIIGYKLKENKYISIKTYYNDDNLLCNKIFIREFDKKI